jgi:hypothetical protein
VPGSGALPDARTNLEIEQKGTKGTEDGKNESKGFLRELRQLEHFHQSCSDELKSADSGLFGFWLPPSPRLRRDKSFRLSYRVFQTCSFAEASPKTKNPRSEMATVFLYPL